jgi:glutamate N-acetyltransferase/amino-acid N-acetyltransferase
MKVINQGTITTPQGFWAGATHSGLKSQGELDLAILYSEKPAIAAGLFTTNKIEAAPVVLSQRRLAQRTAQAIVVNSGRANACTGEAGIADAIEMTASTARKLNLPPEAVLVASTGVIGLPLPIELIRQGIEKINLSREGGHKFARAIMTTDTFPKEIAVSIEIDGVEVAIGGVAKGSGMVHPDLATMLAFLTSDVVIDKELLQDSFKRAVDLSFNMITVDGDTSPNDTVLILANGLAGNKPIERGSQAAEIFQQALEEVCLYLAKFLAQDGEGATKLATVTVTGAVDEAQARQAARTIVSSPLVKSAIHGNDPNWGRIMAALGRSGAEVIESKIDLYLGNLCLVKSGFPQPMEREIAQHLLDQPEVFIKIDLNLGSGEATAWGCDLSEEYVTINSAYTT